MLFVKKKKPTCFKLRYTLNKEESSPMKWTVFPGPWRVDGKGITYIRCTNYSFL